MDDKGKPIGLTNTEKQQKKITELANGCFPPVQVIQRVISEQGSDILAVVVPASEQRPHFTGAAYQRFGSETKAAPQEVIDQWLEYRISKVKFILDWKEKLVTVRGIDPSGNTKYTGHPNWPGMQECYVFDCNPFFVTLKLSSGGGIRTESLHFIELVMDDQHKRLMLLVNPYWSY
jgi:hypothetical protein